MIGFLVELDCEPTVAVDLLSRQSFCLDAIYLTATASVSRPVIIVVYFSLKAHQGEIYKPRLIGPLARIEQLLLTLSSTSSMILSAQRHVYNTSY